MSDDVLREARDLANQAERACRSALMTEDSEWRALRTRDAIDSLREALALLGR